ALECQLHRGPGRTAGRLGHGSRASVAAHCGEPRPQRRSESGAGRAPASTCQSSDDRDLRQDRPGQAVDADASMANSSNRRWRVMTTGSEELQHLQGLVEDYLTVRRALGYQLEAAEASLAGSWTTCTVPAPTALTVNTHFSL